MIFKSPFRKNQGGKYLNAYTITMMLKFPDVERFLSLISQHNFSGAVQRELKDSHLLGMVQPALDAEYQDVAVGDEKCRINSDNGPSLSADEWHVRQAALPLSLSVILSLPLT